MSETMWIVMTVGAWVVVMGTISALGSLSKQADRAQRQLLRSPFSLGSTRTRRLFLQASGTSPTLRPGSRRARGPARSRAPYRRA